MKIHPTKKHTCQICGKELSLEYVYPNRRTIISIKKEFNVNVHPFSIGILELIEEMVKVPNDIEKFKKIFRIKTSLQFTKNGLKDFVKDNFVDLGAKGLLSPGAMSNSPSHATKIIESRKLSTCSSPAIAETRC